MMIVMTMMGAFPNGVQSIIEIIFSSDPPLDDQHGDDSDDGKVELGSLLHRLGVQSIMEITSALPLAQTSH